MNIRVPERNKKKVVVKIKNTEMYVPEIPEHFIILKDTREQMPYQFSGIPSISRKLHEGDYSIENYDAGITIERKGLNDFYGSIAQGRNRFMREMERLKSYEFKGLVIEAEEQDVLCPEQSFRKIHRNTVYSTIVSLEVKHNVHVYYGSRKMCENKVLNWLVKFWNFKNNI